MRISDWSSDVCSSDLLHGVDDPVELFTFQQTLNIEHGAEVNRLLTAHAGGGAVGLDIAAAHEGESPIIDSIAIFKMQRRSPTAAAAAPDIAVVRFAASYLLGDGLGKTSRPAPGPLPIERRNRPHAGTKV